MPRRLDPAKGLPGLFAPGRPKTDDMSFLVAEKRPRRPKRAQPIPAPVATPAPVPDDLRLAPPFRAVPASLPAPTPLSIGEVPSLVACAFGWVASLLRSG